MFELEKVEAEQARGADVQAAWADFMGPSQIDQFVRQAVQFCWGALPRERKTHEELERQIRRLFERALRDFREDREAFSRSSPA
jgi:hypothetical protein